MKTISLGSQTAGVHSYTWDGTQDDGTKAPNGSYSFSINALNNNQQMVATPLNYALVNGVINNPKYAPYIDDQQPERHLPNISRYPAVFSAI